MTEAERFELIDFLKSDGILLTPQDGSDDYVVSGLFGRAFVHAPIFSLSAALLDEYLGQLAETLSGREDPRREALSLTKVHAQEYLATDHGGGANATTSLGFRREPSGSVEFFVEQGSLRRLGGGRRNSDVAWVRDGGNDDTVS
jgi:hypothetical protein